jgi:hypothetical protein
MLAIRIAADVQAPTMGQAVKVVVICLWCAKVFGAIAGILPAWYQTEDRPTGVRLAGFVLAQRVLYPLEIRILRVAVRVARGVWWGPTVGPEAKELREIAIEAQYPDCCD